MRTGDCRCAFFVKPNLEVGIERAKAVDQIALTYTFKNAKPKAADIFDASFLPSAADLKFN